MSADFHKIRRLPPYVFAHIDPLKAKARAEGVDVIDLGMGNPDMPTPEHIVAKLQETVKKTGASKIVFGSEFPMSHPGLELKKIRLLPVSEAEPITLEPRRR